MKTISRTVLTTLSAGFFAALLVSAATAGCGDLSSLQGPFQYAQQRANASSLPSTENLPTAARGARRSSGCGSFSLCPKATRMAILKYRTVWWLTSDMFNCTAMVQN